ncbi:phosphoribosylamine--glycine ligase [Candidatus Enterovibrio escicola]|uniref:Phosphoribosylamine--glycine ligase n=1 Tax=Candidatus Enterovibrio escicola TaxID=1927127 RepID=A0A2A5T6X8_9GAMM|nr:phosphoribosylamine--glycine ligase [Candidatus Enterovibrio escacola]PCS23907.1 Phosphoribosylamine--glycine ligase [Candidatus Enterovibrio escacola]
MNVLVIGNGGREHALAWKAAQSPKVDTVFIAPGNAGTALEPLLKNVEISTEDIPALARFAKDKNIGLTIVGPEGPLVIGIVDIFRAKGLPIFGPTQAAAQLEGSKSFTKDFLSRHKIPSGEYKNFTEVQPALAYVREKNMPIVVKANGLAAGKGVIVAMTLGEAENAIRNMLLYSVFGSAGHCIVIEEFLDGEEASFIVITDGKNVLPMATSQDYKRVGNGDTGSNTGGMGAYSPAPVITPEIHYRVMNEIILPTIHGMATEGNPYTGCLYAGLMIMADGTPKVIEYNCRFGDPETQPIMLRLQSDLITLCEASIGGNLDMVESKWDPRTSLGIVLAAKGYPSAYKTGNIISLPTTELDCTKVFHAGTAEKDGNIVTAGGRVLCATAMGVNVSDAQQRAYELALQISWDGMFHRDDIGYRAIAREQK